VGRAEHAKRAEAEAEAEVEVEVEEVVEVVEEEVEVKESAWRTSKTPILNSPKRTHTYISAPPKVCIQKWHQKILLLLLLL
jgi:hypothetical protein